MGELGDHTASTHPGDRNRFPRLLLLLSPLRSLHADTLEDLFFSGLIGNIQIDSVIPYILKMEPKEYQNHLGVKQEAAVVAGEAAASQSPSGSEAEQEVKVEVAVAAPPVTPCLPPTQP